MSDGRAGLLEMLLAAVLALVTMLVLNQWYPQRAYWVDIVLPLCAAGLAVLTMSRLRRRGS